MSRQLLARTLVVLASVSIVLALVVGYVRHAAVNSDQFANRATVALQDDSVNSLVAEKITDEVVLKNQEDLLAARPIIESVASSVVGSRAFTDLFRSAVRDVHRAVFDRDKDTVTLTVADVGTVIAAALEKVRPSLAKEVGATGKVELVKSDLGSVSGDMARVADEIRVLSLILFVLSLLLVAGALAAAPDKRRTAVELGIGAAIAGVLLVVAFDVLRSVAVDHVDGPDNRAAAGAVWDAFLGDLHTAAWILAGAGAVIAAAAASLIRPVDARELISRAAEWLAREPRRPAFKLVRGAVIVAAGVVVLVARDAVVQLLLTVVGVFLIYEGVTVLLRLIYKAPQPGEVAERRADAAALARRLVVVGIATGLIVLAVGIFVGSGGTTTAAPARGGCDGHRELCDRPLDEVVLPATHNSMSVPLSGLVLGRAGQADRRPAGRRGARPAGGHPLRRPPAERQAAHLLRQPRGAAPPGQAGRREPGRRGCRPGHPRSARIRGRGRAGHVPLPHVLRARGEHPGFDPRRHPRLPRQPSRRCHGRDQPGLRDAGGLRRRREEGRARGPGLQGTGGRRLADAAGDDRQRPAAGPARREPRGRGPLVPPRLRDDHRGDPVQILQGRPAHRARTSCRRAASPTAARSTRRSSSSTTGSRRTRSRCRPRRRW